MKVHCAILHDITYLSKYKTNRSTLESTTNVSINVTSPNVDLCYANVAKIAELTQTVQ